MNKILFLAIFSLSSFVYSQNLSESISSSFSSEENLGGVQLEVNQLFYKIDFIKQQVNQEDYLNLIEVFNNKLVYDTANAATAQEMNTRPTEKSRAAKTSENRAAIAASDLQWNANRPAELAEFEAKINTLLSLVRSALMIESNAAKFHENLEQPIRMKSEQVCPNIALMDLIKGATPFTASSEMDKQELLYAIDFLNVSINGMLTK